MMYAFITLLLFIPMFLLDILARYATKNDGQDRDKLIKASNYVQVITAIIYCILVVNHPYYTESIYTVGVAFFVIFMSCYAYYYRNWVLPKVLSRENDRLAMTDIVLLIDVGIIIGVIAMVNII